MTASPRATSTRASKAPAKRRSSSNGAGRRGRPKGSGTRGAEALALVKESPGITIPDDARAAMRTAGERGSEAGIEMADRLLAATEGRVAGTYIMPSFGRYEQCAELVRRIRARHPAVAAAS